MQWQTKTADKSTARLVLWTLAEARHALTSKEIAFSVVVSDQRAVQDALDALTDAGLIVHRDGKWAISDEAPGASLWAESYGDDAFRATGDKAIIVVTTRGISQTELVFPIRDSQWHDESSERLEGFYNLWLDAARSGQSLTNEEVRELLIRAHNTVEELRIKHAQIRGAEPLDRKSKRILRKRIRQLFRSYNRREKYQSTMRSVTAQMKLFFDALGPPPGWNAGVSSEEAGGGR